jgi:hypothetical protein
VRVLLRLYRRVDCAQIVRIANKGIARSHEFKKRSELPRAVAMIVRFIFCRRARARLTRRANCLTMT